MMTHLISYLEEKADRGMSDTVTKRVEEFGAWCKSQPEGKDAGDDARTIAVIGLCEKVICNDKLYPLAVKLFTRDELIGGRQYLLRWVSESQYARVLALYDNRRK
jgi:hypothetical protein